MLALESPDLDFLQCAFVLAVRCGALTVQKVVASCAQLTADMLMVV